MNTEQPKIIELPAPFATGGLSLVEAVAGRRSVRSFSPDSLQLFHLSQILWAAQGITSELNNSRAVPSAGGTYPLDVYVVIGENGVETCESGVYRYEVENHILSLQFKGEARPELADAALGQDFISVAPISLVICAVYDKTMARYNIRGERYVFMEAGHAGQNIYLQATALNLGTVAVGAFKDEEVRKVLRLDSKTKPLYIMPIGKRI
jgi:SagB-type dehydrogenase family enzyme